MPNLPHDPTERFGDRVDDYFKYRPRYPAELVDLAVDAQLLEPGGVVADVGSGTGFVAERFLERGYAVYCIEPNAEMRASAEAFLGGTGGFVSVDGTAEATGLADNSIDFVVVGQAFHWFDATRARAEFVRILRPHRGCMLVWNARSSDHDQFALDYEALIIRYNTDYLDVRHRGITSERTEDLTAFFGAGGMTRTHVGVVVQRFDFPGLRGRLFSSSYMPNHTDPRADTITADLRTIFDRHNVNGFVEVVYDTWAYHGRIT